jgi:actin, other eukaryote
MESIWHHLYDNELRIPSENHAVLVDEPPLNPKSNREMMMQSFFESFQIPAFHVSIQAVWAFYAYGRGCGAVLHSGDGTTHIVPIWQGYTFPHAVSRINVAGGEVTDRLQTLLGEKGCLFNSSGQREIVRDIKERSCYVAIDSAKELERINSEPTNKSYQLPDGQEITLGEERFSGPEALFQPALLGLSNEGIHHYLFDAIKKCDIDIRRDLLGNIIVVCPLILTKLFR